MSAPRPRPEILDISPYIGGESTVPGVNRVLKLSSNEGAFGVPPGAQAAYAKLAGELYRYPDGDATELRRAIGARFKLDPARIVCGAGSDDLIYQLCLAYGGPGREIVMSEHGFSIYQIAGTYSGSRVIKTRERNLTADAGLVVDDGNVPAGTRRQRFQCGQKLIAVHDCAIFVHIDRVLREQALPYRFIAGRDCIEQRLIVRPQLFLDGGRIRLDGGGLQGDDGKKGKQHARTPLRFLDAPADVFL